MSDQEHFLSRWSRRKREVAEAEAEANAETQAEARPEGEIKSESASVPAQLKGPGQQQSGEPAFDITTLPPLESITADSDIRAFLAPGVPVDLQRAALRRAWSADPAIRDFVGLSENSWDFNDPQAMPGFGPLQMTDDMRRIVAQLFTSGPDQQRPADASDDATQQPEVKAEPASVELAEPVQEAARAQDESGRIIEEFPACDELSQRNSNIAAAQPAPAEQPAACSSGRRCHGGALPK
jgi:hypothetical protein